MSGDYCRPCPSAVIEFEGRYKMHPGSTEGPQGLCIAAIDRALRPKACLVGLVRVGAGTHGKTVSRIIVYFFNGLYKHGPADLVDLWEARGLMRQHLPVKGDLNRLDINVVGRGNLQLVQQECMFRRNRLKDAQPTSNRCGPRNSTFITTRCSFESPRLLAFFTKVETVQGMQPSISRFSQGAPS